MTKEEFQQELQHLSEALNRRADALEIIHDEKFRNYNGMVKSSENMLYVLSNGEKGFPNVSRMMYDVIDLWKNDNAGFMRILDAFMEKYW